MPKLATLVQLEAARRRQAGFLIKEQRLAAGLTQAEVVRALGLGTKQELSNWETGRSGIPAWHLPLLAETIRMEAKWLAKVVLRVGSPHVFGMIFGIDQTLQAELDAFRESQAASRLKRRRV